MCWKRHTQPWSESWVQKEQTHAPTFCSHSHHLHPIRTVRAVLIFRKHLHSKCHRLVRCALNRRRNATASWSKNWHRSRDHLRPPPRSIYVAWFVVTCRNNCDSQHPGSVPHRIRSGLLQTRLPHHLSTPQWPATQNINGRKLTHSIALWKHLDISVQCNDTSSRSIGTEAALCQVASTQNWAQ